MVPLHHGGATFNTPINSTPGLGFLNDTHSVAVDNFTGAGREPSTSRRKVSALIPASICSNRHRDGLTFTGGTFIAGASVSQNPIISVGPDHRVNVTYYDRPFGFPSIVTRRSTDGGVTFGAPVTVETRSSLRASTAISAWSACARHAVASRLPIERLSAGEGERGQWPHVRDLCRRPAGIDKANVFFRVSTDNGATWSAAVRINSDINTTSDQWSPNIAVTPDGSRVGFFCDDRRNDQLTTGSSLLGRICSDTGVTLICGTDFAVSDVDFLPEFGRDSVVNPTYMGDQDFADADNNFSMSAWGDKRNAGLVPRMNPDVFFDRIPDWHPRHACAGAGHGAAAAGWRPRRHRLESPQEVERLCIGSGPPRAGLLLCAQHGRDLGVEVPRKLAIANEAKCNCVRATERGKEAWSETASRWTRTG